MDPMKDKQGSQKPQEERRRDQSGQERPFEKPGERRQEPPKTDKPHYNK